ncbi:MAG: hypothetical protein A3F84_19275 [Candidatus Handelsmanbacteria bacterium RIFCSPLOWO2_12_FULL_64_10]|uniref:TonB-dependent receptor plug domain-containing protein n=1 Tax=Handelsmanbacteria sp. (strain RIFCSPLOWO2_12_FULL_64_10) TaxID=1817868 RepID=A0A1F6D0E9_HANXR|nr:MAG: hypothetical protein A3F84_19275 [Candidatus Handelsmanbacteria bacterium RIFCSPLOWO2_12_FULL_64_10]
MDKGRVLGAIFLALGLLVLGTGGPALAATTGKITGLIKDASTGEGLPGVNVAVEGKSRGAVSDAEGRYLILAVEPGIYSLTASIVGYGKEMKGKVQVVADYTTTVDFALKAEAVAMGEVVVTAERPAVEPDKTTSKYVVTASDIESVPMVRTPLELIALQPGMALDGSNRIRGSDGAGGVGYYIDGIAVGRGVFTEVTNSAIQEVSVLTGGMNAEFGNARAGAVTLVTKEGENKFHGKVEYKLTPPGKRHWGENLYASPAQKGHTKWDSADWVNETDPQTGKRVHERTDYTDYTGHQAEASLSGPLGTKASFFFSTRYVRGVRSLPSAVPTSPFNTRNLATLTFHPGPNLKVKVGGLFQRNKDYYVPNSNYEGSAKGMGPNNSGRNIFLPERWSAAGRQIFQDDMVHLTLTHSLGSKTYYEVKVYQVGSKADTADVPAVTEPVRMDRDGWFYLPRKIHAYTFFSDRRYGVQADFTSQVSPVHLLQTGLSYKKHSYHEITETTAPTPKERYVSFVGKDYEPGKPVRPWEVSLYAQDKLEFRGLVVNAGVRWDYLNFARKQRQAPGMELFPMFNRLSRRKLEAKYFEGPTLSMTSLSPRIGVSHPISDRLSGHYFIGRFNNFPGLRALYNVEYTTQNPDVDLNKNGAIDPAEKWNALEPVGWSEQTSEEIQPEAATSVEMGVDWNFYQDYVADITAHYRLDEGLLGIQGTWLVDPQLGQTFYAGIMRNSKAQRSRGFEASVRKNFSHNFSFRVGYEMQWVSGTEHYGDRESWYIYPDSNYIASGKYWISWKVEADGSETPVPLTPDQIRILGAKANQIVREWGAKSGQSAGLGYYTPQKKINDAGIYATTSGYGYTTEPLYHDRRNQLSVQFLYATPLNYGPRVGGMHPFGGLKISSIHRLLGGLPFEFYPLTGPRQWKQEPPVLRTDLHAEKEFGKAGGIQATLFLEVTNLFNEKNAASRYTNFTYIQYGLKEMAPDDPDYLKYGDINDWNRNYYNPRLVEVGLMFRF